MVLLLAVYQLFLGREKMHRFSRYYLLAALLFSLVTPFISFETEQMVIPTLSTVVVDQPLMQENDGIGVLNLLKKESLKILPIGISLAHMQTVLLSTESIFCVLMI